MENSPAEESPEEPAEEPVVDNNSTNEDEEVTAAVLLPIREEEANQNEDRESGGVGEEAGNVELSSSVEDTGGRKSKGETEEATGEGEMQVLLMRHKILYVSTTDKIEFVQMFRYKLSTSGSIIISCLCTTLQIQA